MKSEVILYVAIRGHQAYHSTPQTEWELKQQERSCHIRKQIVFAVHIVTVTTNWNDFQRPCNVVRNVTIRWSTYDFLCPFRGNYGPILYRFPQIVRYWLKIGQKLSYSKQIACQLCTQYVEGICRPKYYTVTFKSQYSTVVLTVVRVMIAKYRKSGIWGYRSSLTPEPIELK